ncbi:MAG: hypothetical protein H6512_07885 [Acidimicrobiia bacterium]|nr:hypothetical protein [Acidimicrobiia bacterium]
MALPSYHRLDHLQLAALGREYLMAGHMIDRAGMPYLIGQFDREPMQAVAIAEWMGASPIYSRRMAALLGIEGDSVETVFKGMQFDIGAPPEFLDFRYEVIDDDHGEFWLAHCGALMDVEPMGEDFVVGMCHTIEDPTFLATAAASNPRARMVPVHRPPRIPADRHPHCRWQVLIDRDAEPLALPDEVAALAGCNAANVPVSPVHPEATGPGPGMADDWRAWVDYRAPLDSDVRLEDFAGETLSCIVQEAALQGHLLVASFVTVVEQNHGRDAAWAALRTQGVGTAGLVAERLIAEFDLPSTIEGAAALFDLHPAFRPEGFISWEVQVDVDSLVLTLGECPALADGQPFNWMSLLAEGDDAMLVAIGRALDDRVVVQAMEPPSVDASANSSALANRSWSWQVTFDGDPVPETDDVLLAKFSTGATFKFHRTGYRNP